MAEGEPMKKRIVVAVAVALVCGGGLVGGSVQAKPPASAPGQNVWNWGRCGDGGVVPGTMWGPFTTTPNGDDHAPYLVAGHETFLLGFACQS